MKNTNQGSHEKEVCEAKPKHWCKDVRCGTGGRNLVHTLACPKAWKC